jgi:hypothetical protein
MSGTTTVTLTGGPTALYDSVGFDSVGFAGCPLRPSSRPVTIRAVPDAGRDQPHPRPDSPRDRPPDAVLLSLGRHQGDLDPAGRSLIGQVPLALSTASAAR